MPGFLRRIGALRVMLAALTLAVVAFAPFARGEVSYSGWAMVPTLIVPAISPIVFFVLLLDMLMARVFLGSTDETGRQRYRTVLWMDVVLVGLLVLAWIPFFMTLGK
jgi:hypothetical protein